jgi:hypothetical protein
MMMGQSNDWFYAPAESGIDLFENGRGISGDITSQMVLWDAGTEVDQEPGIGSDQDRGRKRPTPAPLRMASCAMREMSNTAALIRRCLT